MKVLNQQIIKQNNLHKVFSFILNNPQITRIGLAEITALSKTTISALVDELITKGYVLDEGMMQTGRQGRKPCALRVNSQHNVVAVINWHIEKLEISLVDLSGDIVMVEYWPVTHHEDFPRMIRKAYDDVLCKNAGSCRILGFCLIVPSMLDPEKKRMISTTLPLPENSDVISEICALFTDVPVAIFNDTACYAYAENTLSQLAFNTFTFININKGVGAVIVSNGIMLQGEGGKRAQLGHYSLHRNGRQCVCGNRGCLENEIGESAIAQRAQDRNVYQALQQAGCVSSNGEITFKQLGEKADAGVAEVKAFVNDLAADLAFTLGNLFTIYNTSQVIIGGRGQKLGKYYLQQLDKHLKATGFTPFVEDVKMQYTALGDDAIMRGAARYFIDKYYDFFNPMENFVVLE